MPIYFVLCKLIVHSTEGSTIIPLSVVPHYKEPPIIQPYVAAVLNNEFNKYVHTQWDLTTLRVHCLNSHAFSLYNDINNKLRCISQILPYINGFNHMDRIAAMADVALGLVLDCIKHLILLGVAIMVPVFQYSNIYRPTPKLSQLAKCIEMQNRCIEQCSRGGNGAVSSRTGKAKVRDIFRIFASMAHGATFGELCVRFNPAALNIHEKQMVLFGQLEGLIRRVDKYPITVPRNLFNNDEPIRTTSPTSENTDILDLGIFAFSNSISRPLPRGERPGKSHLHHHRQSETNNSFPSRQRHTSGSKCNGQHSQSFFYNGLKSFDEICMKRGISCQQLESQLAKDRHVIVLLK